MSHAHLRLLERGGCRDFLGSQMAHCPGEDQSTILSVVSRLANIEIQDIRDSCSGWLPGAGVGTH